MARDDRVATATTTATTATTATARGPPRRETRARIDATTLEALRRVAAKASAEEGETRGGRDAAFDLASVKEAVEFLSSPRAKTSRRESRDARPRL